MDHTVNRVEVESMVKHHSKYINLSTSNKLGEFRDRPDALRRQLLKGLSLGVAASVLPLSSMASSGSDIIKKVIPSTQEPLTAVGLGTWQAFNVGSDKKLLEQRTRIVELFFKLGGQMIDSSPMYGSSQDTIGYALSKLGTPYAKQLFSAEKVWTRDGSATRQHIDTIAKKWGVADFDLMQVHNLLSWQAHLEALKEMKSKGRLRYIGITTSHGRRHDDLEKIMATEPLDFVQLTYNLDDREVENRLLPLAKERGIAIIVNRPFQGGYLLDRLQRQKAVLPAFAQSIGCNNWPQFCLKFIISHPAVTCAIPATTQLEHLSENMAAAKGPLPNAAMRQQMLAYFKTV